MFIYSKKEHNETVRIFAAVAECDGILHCQTV